MRRASDLTKAKRAAAFCVFCAVCIVCLDRAAASVTYEKPNPTPPPAGQPEMWQIPYDIETGLPRNILIGASGLPEPTGPTIFRYNTTNAVMSAEMAELINFMESLRNE